MSSSGRSRSFISVCKERKPICLWGPQRAKVHTVFEHWEAQRLMDVKTHCRVSSSMTSTTEVVSITAKTRLRRNNKNKSGLRILSYPAASWPNIHGNSPSGSCKIQNQCAIPSIHTVSYSTHISASNWNPIATKIFSYTISENCYKSIPSRPQYGTLEIKIGWRKVWLSKMV